MRVGIHQPNYLPWGGYFYKILCSDIFIFLDDAQYTKNSFINRNRIKTPQGPQWLTVPVNGSIMLGISEVGFASEGWVKKHIKTLEGNYAKAPYFAEYFPDIAGIMTESKDLCQLNMRLIQHIAELLGAGCRFARSSEMDCRSSSDDRLIELVKAVHGDVYLSGAGGSNYQSEEKYTNNGILLEYMNYRQQTYPQLWGEFEPNLSIIDIVFNCGPGARQLILSGGGKGRQ